MNNGEIYFGIARSLYGILFIILYTYVRYVPSGMRALVPTFLNNIDFLKLRYYLFFFSGLGVPTEFPLEATTENPFSFVIFLDIIHEK